MVLHLDKLLFTYYIPSPYDTGIFLAYTFIIRYKSRIMYTKPLIDTLNDIGMR